MERRLMASYTIVGHPLNYAALGYDASITNTLHALLNANGVGSTITVTIADDSKAKGHGILK